MSPVPPTNTKELLPNAVNLVSSLTQRDPNEPLALFQWESGGHFLGPADPVPEVVTFLNLKLKGNQVGLLVSTQDERSRADIL